jgi:hypothetical protein
VANAAACMSALDRDGGRGGGVGAGDEPPPNKPPMSSSPVKCCNVPS